MTTINELILSARYELGDTQGTTYSPYQMIDQYNKGNKLLRQTILHNNPMQLAEEETGTVTAGSAITLAKKPIKLIDIRVNGNRIDKISLLEISDKTTTGEPTAYYLLNTNTIKLYPLPDKSYAYELIYITETAKMAETVDSGYQTDIEELLVRYLVASMTGKGFDLVAEYNGNIGKLLSEMETGVTVTEGYYSSGCGGGDYR